MPPACSVCTTTEYDSLGRPFRVTTPDGAQINTTYSASITGVTDMDTAFAAAGGPVLYELEELLAGIQAQL